MAATRMNMTKTNTTKMEFSKMASSKMTPIMNGSLKFSGSCNRGVLEKQVQTNNTDVQFLLQAASGLSYMRGMNLIRIDIAGRNCHNYPMVNVSDCGLARQGPVFKMIKDYAVSVLECLDEENLVWTTESDCWSFGVFMWHMFENCKRERYTDLLVTNSNTLKDMLKTGTCTRLKPPATMPNQLKELMMKCFNTEPSKRSDMEEIQEILYCCLRRLYPTRPNRTRNMK